MYSFFSYYLIGIGVIKEKRKPFLEETFELCKNSDKVLFGAFGNSEFDNNTLAKIISKQELL